MKNNLSRLLELTKNSLKFAREFDSEKNFVTTLPKEIHQLDGMCGNNTRLFLNNVIFNDCNHLEIGTWKGSTLCSSLFGRNPNKSFSIDNFSEFGDVRDEFLSNVEKHIKGKTKFIEANCFEINPSEFEINEIDVYFYDGPHRTEDHYNSLKYYLDYLSKFFILAVDDYQWTHTEYFVSKGTLDAIKDLNLKVHLEDVLKDDQGGQLGVFVLEKP